MWMMFRHRIYSGPLAHYRIGRSLPKVGLSLATMTQAARLIGHRGGVPIYQYRTDPDASPVSVHRHINDLGERGRHIHDFPALWYVPGAGVVYVAAAGEVLDAEQ